MKFKLRIVGTQDERLFDQVGSVLPQPEFTSMKEAIEFLDNHYLTSNVEVVTFGQTRGSRWCTPVAHRNTQVMA